MMVKKREGTREVWGDKRKKFLFSNFRSNKKYFKYNHSMRGESYLVQYIHLFPSKDQPLL